MQLTKMLLPSSKYNIKSPYSMNPTRIVVHNTANDASAMAEISYMIGNNNQVSFHYAVDDYRVVQGIEENRNAWHSGDGNGKGNRQGIAIEICYSKSGGDKFIKAEENAVELIVSILKRYGWGIDRVTKHQDYSRKYCPHRTLDMGWERFLNQIRKKLGQSVQSSQSFTTANNTNYNGSSIVDALKSIGVDSSFANRSKIANLNGISNYTGTVLQNTQLLNLLKQGSLILGEGTNSNNENCSSKTSAESQKNYVNLPSNIDTWNFYDVGVSPVKKNAKGQLKPSKFGGLSYYVYEYRDQGTTAVINTVQFGKVKIYIKDTPATITIGAYQYSSGNH